MARIKGKKIKYGQFAEKQYIMPDGRKMEEIPMKECAIHYDNSILSVVATHVLQQAVQDWHKLNKKERKICTKSVGETVWRFEVASFFNSTFFACLLEVLMPDIDHEEALKYMLEQEWTDRQIGMGRGPRPGTRSREAR